MKQPENLIRKTWPKIRLVSQNGRQFYQVDGRYMVGDKSEGRRESFPLDQLAEARKRAAQIESDHKSAGREGVAMDPILRGMAISGAARLQKYGKTLNQAVDFYIGHLEAREAAANSATVEKLADEWIQKKEMVGDKDKRKLRKPTLTKLKATRAKLIEAFGPARIVDIGPAEADAFYELLPQKLSSRRRYDIISKFRQFFNWCIKQKKGITSNPFGHIEITPADKEVEIFTPAEAEKLMRLCENQFPDFTVFYALALFAGLRPDFQSENQKLKWEDIFLEKRMIYIHRNNSKVKRDRNVPIEDNLLAWLTAYRPENAKGFITSPKNFQKNRQAVHVAMGYKVGKDNPGAKTWPQDVTRHSFCSYWLGKYENTEMLAVRSGNSARMIEKHYQKPVMPDDWKKYWSILPK